MAWITRTAADVLQGDLAFLPFYSKGSVPRLIAVRLAAYIKGWGRLLCGRVRTFRSWRDAWAEGSSFLIPFLIGRLVVGSTPGLRHFLRERAPDARPAERR